MYYRVFRWIPKKAISRLAGRLAAVRWPRWVLRPVIAAYVAWFRIDMSVFETPPAGFPTFNAFFTRGLKPGARPVDAQPEALVSPVDGAVIEGGPVSRGRLLQAKGREYSLPALLGEEPGWEGYNDGAFLTLYLSPRDYHRIHSPCAGRVRRFTYLPGELWTVSPRGVAQVPGLFTRNERLITYIETAFGEVAVVAVGATVVGGIRVVYDDITSNRPGAGPVSRTLDVPWTLERGQELGRFELGSTVIVLVRSGEARLDRLPPGRWLAMGQAIGQVTTRAARAGP